ncbi:MAG: hypothetical protein M0Z75_13720 [Nitrospiraceae bacterium]|nr:hypothetical protein [Nitrospiraceae bacterium]
MADPKPVLAAIIDAHEHIDGTLYAETMVGFVSLVTFLLDIERSGGKWQSLGMARITKQQVNTIVTKLFVMIPGGTDAARYLQAAIIETGDHPAS